MQWESRWLRRCGSEARNSPNDARLQNQAAEDQETQVYLGLAVSPSFSISENSSFPEISSSGRCLKPPVFNRFPVASVLHFPLRHWPGWWQCSASRRQPMTLRIERSARQRLTVLTLSGRMEAEQVSKLLGPRKESPSTRRDHGTPPSR